MFFKNVLPKNVEFLKYIFQGQRTAWIFFNFFKDNADFFLNFFNHHLSKGEGHSFCPRVWTILMYPFQGPFVQRHELF